MNFEKSFTTKLYIPRYVEGAPSQETFDACRRLEKAFQDRKEFIGLTPFGSTMKGYANRESDIDIWILVDMGAEEVSEDNATALAALGRSFVEEAHKIGEEFFGKGINLSPKVFLVSKEVNRTRIQHKLLDDEADPIVVASLFELTTGEKIKAYRDDAIREIKTLSELDRKMIVERMTTALAERDCLHLFYAQRRTESKLDKEKILQQRKLLWQKRIELFLK